MKVHRLGVRRTCLAVVSAVTLVLGAGPARGAPTSSDAQAQCMKAYTDARQSEQAGRLLEEKGLLVECMKPTCGRFLQKECLTRSTQLESDIPTVVPRVTGAVPADLQIRIDGTLLTTGLGEPVAVDPGLHEFTFSTPDGSVKVSEKLMILQGETNRPVAVSLLGHGGPGATHDAEGAGKTEPSAGPSALAFLLGGIGVAGLGGGAALFVLEKQTTWNLAVDSLGIGAGALLGSIWLFANPRSEKTPPPRAAYSIDLRATASGGIASLAGIF